ncbi:MAG: flagellar biosynthesis protein FliQ [Treponema sp.]|nr:flagellar biosynthesis protein FliQ [Treponema sp.]
MSLGEATFMIRQAVYHILLLASPLLISALVVGLVIAILQATTSIQEQTLTFVPKIFVIMLMLALLGGAGFGILADYSRGLFGQISGITG